MPTNEEQEFAHLMYVWAVEMASVWDKRGDLDGYCHWWSWRIAERWDETERVAYEAWKYQQLRQKFDESVRDAKKQKGDDGYRALVIRDSNRPLHGLDARPRSRSSSLAISLASMALAGFEGPYLAAGPSDQVYPHNEPKICTHRFGIAGGFSSCSACGISARRARQQQG